MVAGIATRSLKRVAQKRRMETSPESPSPDSVSESGDVYQHENIPDSGSEDAGDVSESEKTRFRQPPRKKRRNRPALPADMSEIPDFEENQLFKALSLPEVAVSELALEWLESFEEDEANSTSFAITELFNLVLRACGCTRLAQAHDMLNEDSAPATVAEIAIFFGRQQLHEYPFTSTSKNVRHFRVNVQEFFRNIVSLGHEKGSLYRPESDEHTSSLGAPMMNCVLAWLLVLSSCTIRPLRFVATILVLEIQTQLCELASSVTIALQKQQRQLSNARNNAKGRNQRVQKSKIAIIQESVDTFTRQSDTVTEYIGDIFQQVFVDRYRDVNLQVRAECLRALALWMVKYEEMFLKADYLRYLGWLLSDPADSVRLEAVRLVHRLYKFVNGKREAMSLGFRQFTDRYKDQYISMVWKEKPTRIRTQLLEILSELFGLGFLTDADVCEICLYGFHLASNEKTPHADIRAKTEVCRFMAAVCEERSRMEVEPFSAFLRTHGSGHFDAAEGGTLSVAQGLKYRLLCLLMEATLAHYYTVLREMKEQAQKPAHVLVDLLFRGIYAFPAFQGQWEGLIKYVLCDFSAVKFTPKLTSSTQEDPETSAELVSKLAILTLSEKCVCLSFIASSIMHVLVTEAPKKNPTKPNASSKSDDLDSALPVLVKYMSDLEEFLRTDTSLYAVFMCIWSALLTTVPASISRLFSTVSDVSEYNAIHEKALHYYLDMGSSEPDVYDAYDTYFALVLKSYEGSVSGLINANIKLQIEELLHSLVHEGLDVFLLEEPIVDTDDSEENALLPLEQKIAISRLLRATPILQKFSQIARIVNINNYVAEPIADTSDVLVDVLHTKLVSRFKFLTFVQVWPLKYAALKSQVSVAWLSVLEFLLLSLSWKLEDLTYASSDNSAHQIDIGLFLDDFHGLLVSVGDLFVTVGNAAKELNVTTSHTDLKMRSLLQNLVSLENTFASHYIDVLVALRTFHEKFHTGENFKYFLAFFGNEAGIGAFVKGPLPNILQDSFKRVFLIHEARLAHLKHGSLDNLDRQSDEDVNFGDFVFANYVDEDESSRMFDELREDDVSGNEGRANAAKERQIWAAERALCVYTLKLFGLVHTHAFAVDVVARFQLNSTNLSGLFLKIIEAGNAQYAGPDDALPDELGITEPARPES